MLFRDWGILLKNNAPSQSMIKRGYMLYWLKTIEKDGKPFKKVPVTLVTIEGLAYLRKIIRKKLKDIQKYVESNRKKDSASVLSSILILKDLRQIFETILALKLENIKSDDY